MVQWMRALAVQVWRPEFKSQNPHKMVMSTLGTLELEDGGKGRQDLGLVGDQESSRFSERLREYRAERKSRTPPVSPGLHCNDYT